MLRDETDNSFMEWLQWNENIEKYNIVLSRLH